MKPLDALLRFSLLAFAWVLSSCIDGHEEYWIAADGSGRAEVDYQIPSTVAHLHGGENGIRAALREFLDSTPELKNPTLQVTTEGSQLRVKASVAFDSALDLRKVAAGASIHELPDSASHLAGAIHAETHGRTLDFKRTIFAAKAIPGVGLMPASQLDGHSLTYIMHLPTAASESNATRTADSGKTLIWECPLAQAVERPFVTRFQMPVPLPWSWMLWITAPIATAGGVLAWRWSAGRSKPRVS